MASEEDLKKNARETSIKEGSFASIMSGVGDNYISPFMVSLTNNPLPISMLSSLPGILSPLAQTFGSRLMETNSRKRIVLYSVFFHAIIWFPISIIGLLYYFNFAINYLAYGLLILYSLIAISGGFGGPAWFSWMGDIVPQNERGGYFSRRNKIAGTVSVIAFLSGAFLLDYFKTQGIASLGFTILFAIAGSARIISFTFFRKQYEPELKLDKDYYFSFIDFLKRRGDFWRFTMFQASFYFSLMIASPFFAVYMLEHLQFNYATYTIVSISSTLVYLFFLPIAGKFSDKYGNSQLLVISGVFYALYPLSWIFIKDPFILISISQVIIGIGTAGYTISTTNFIYDTVTPQRRGICTAYMNILIGIGTFFGAISGGLIIKYMPANIIEPIFAAFIISSMGRLLTTILIVPRIKERRKTEKINFGEGIHELLYALGTEGRNLGIGFQQSLLTPIMFIKNATKRGKEEGPKI
jgi:MFS family permease